MEISIANILQESYSHLESKKDLPEMYLNPLLNFSVLDVYESVSIPALLIY